MAAIGSIIISLEARLDKFQRGMDQANRQLDSVDRNTKNLSSSFEQMEKTASRVGTAIKAIALGGVVQQIGSAALASERLTNSLKFATGSAEGAADALQFVRAEADRLGLSATSTGQAFAGIAAAAQGTALQGDAVREVFLGVAEASAALGLSADNTEGALLALSQIISKGTVQAEELRGQLGERIPGAFQIAARAMGVTTAELGKMLEKGEVIADDFLPRFAAEMRRSFGGAATDAATGLNAAINRLTNAYDELLRTLAESGAIDAATRIITNLGNILFNVSTILGRAKTAVIEFFDQFRDAPQTLTGTASKLEMLSQKIIRVSQQRINSPFPEKLDETIAELRAEYDKLQKEYLKTSDAQSELTLEVKDGFRPVQALSTGLDKLGESSKKTGRAARELKVELTDLERAQNRFDEAIRNYPAQEIVRDLERQFDAQEKVKTSTQEIVTEGINPMAEAFERTFERLDNVAADFWRSLFEGGKFSFDALKGLFTQTLAEIAHALTTRRFTAAITGSLASAPAVAGGGGLFGFGGPPVFGPERISSLGLPTGISNILASSSFATNPFLSGAGGFGGNLGANLLFGGDRGAGANIGGTIGAIGGSFLPLPPGLGTAIGGFVGNLIGGLFGGGNDFRASLGTALDRSSPALSGTNRDVVGESAFGFVGFAQSRDFSSKDAKEFIEGIVQLDNAIAGSLLPTQVDKIREALDGFIGSAEKGTGNLDQIKERIGFALDAAGGLIDDFSDRILEGPVEAIPEWTAALNALQQTMDSDLVEDFKRAIEDQNVTMLDAMNQQAQGVLDLVGAYDGSLSATQRLASGVSAFGQTAVHVLAEIEKARRGIADSTLSAIERIRTSVMTPSEQLTFFTQQGAAEFERLKGLFDPAAINESVQSLQSLTERVFALVGQVEGEQNQRGRAGEFIDFLRDVQAIAQSRLNVSEQTVTDTQATIQAELRSALQQFSADMGAISQSHAQAASTNAQAAQTQAIAAQTQLTAARTPVRVIVDSRGRALSEVGR